MLTNEEAALPVLYKSIVALSSQAHLDWRYDHSKKPNLSRVHAVPLTTDEFAIAQRHYPIIFSVGENPVPLALMGLVEGSNVLTDHEGNLPDGYYVPAYIRRFPFLLARMEEGGPDLA